MKNADTEDDLIPHSDLTDPPDPPGEERGESFNVAPLTLSHTQKDALSAKPIGCGVSETADVEREAPRPRPACPLLHAAPRSGQCRG